MIQSARNSNRRRLRRLNLESLEARRVFAGLGQASIGGFCPEVEVATLVQQQDEDLTLHADGLVDLSHLANSTGDDLQQIVAALEEHDREHVNPPRGRPMRDYAELVYGPLQVFERGAAAAVSSGPFFTNAIGGVAAATSSGLVMPVLNSLPGASASLFLDFDGHFESVWGQYTNVTSPPLDLDGDTTSFSADELAYITDVWSIVAEDFSPFNINVTTVEPPTLAPGSNPSAANGIALRIAIGGGVEILGLDSGVIGYAYYNSFTSSVSNVAYVMPVRSGGTIASPVSIGTVSSHEAGHSFGLRHQLNGVDYSNRWQSIMYSSIFGYEDAYWTAGTNDQGNFQDDLATLANSTNGFGYRAEDHGNSISTATELTKSGSAWVGSGIIGSSSDGDVWKITTTDPQSMKISIEGAALGQNLDAVVELLDAGGNVVLTSDPTESADAQLIFDGSGTQYFRVRSTGAYGRIGQYTITASASSPGLTVSARPTLITSESGASDQLSLVLTSKPASDVVVTLASGNALEGAVAPSPLVFTPDNWFLPQSAIVQGADDNLLDGPQAYSVTLSVASTDPDYSDLVISPLPAINADDEMPGWATNLQGTSPSSSIYTNDIFAQADGSILTTGSFSGTVDFDPGIGVSERTASYLSNGYVAKYSASGALLWVNTYGSTQGLTSTYAIVADLAGNVYITGSTSSNSLTLGSTTLTGQGGGDAFLAKLNNSGNFVWAKGWGGSGSDASYDLAFDGSGNVFAVGNFSGTVDFNPAAGVASRTSSGDQDGFLVKFDSNGNYLSVATFGGVNTEYPRELEIDGAGNLYISGYFIGGTQLGSYTLTSSGSSDAFLMRMSPAGNIDWVRQAITEAGSGANNHLSRSATGVLHWASSSFSGEVSFGPGTPTISNAGTGNGIYLASFDDSGNFLDLGQLNSSENLVLGDIAADAQGGVAIYGRMSATADLDPSAAVRLVEPIATNADFVVRLDSNQQLVSTEVIPTPNWNTVARDLTFDVQGNLIVSGQFYEHVLTPTGAVLSNSTGNYATYLMKLNLAPGVELSANSLQVSENGDQASVLIALATAPTADVVVTLSSSDISEGSVAPTTLVFSSANWRTPQLVTITGIDDAAVDGDQPFEIQLSLASSDPNYHGLTIPAIQVVNTDNDQPLVLFADSFEVSEWNGSWVEDSQNDWYRSNQRATNGLYSAEVDGLATNATLTTATSINLSEMQSATLTFDWLIESSFDSGEFLALDVSTNGGVSWIQDVRRLNGNVSAENVWHSEFVDLTPYITSSVKVRFRSTVSGSDEDANVDNVKIAGIPAGPNATPNAVVGGPYNMDEGSSVVLSGAGSFDPDGTIVSYAWDLDNDGQYDDASGSTAAFTTTASGSHVVGLLVTDNRGATHSVSTTVIVNNVAPTADAGSDLNGFVGTSLNLTAANSSDPGNDIVAYAWDLDDDGDFDDASGVNTTFVATAAGMFTVRVRVTDADGASSTDSTLINISNTPTTKFYVVNDGSTDRTYEYDANGNSVENYGINSGNTAPRGAASTAAGTTVWVADKNRKVYVYNTSGGLLGSWTAGTLASNALVEGLATNGTDVWIVDNRTDRVYRYSNAAGRLSGSQTAASNFALNSGNTNPKGIVTDGTHLWVVNASSTDRVFKYSLSGTLVGSWTIDTANTTPTGLTIDPSNGSQHIWIVDSGTDKVYEYADARSRTSGSQAASATFNLAAGNSNPQGIADPPPPSDSTLQVSTESARPTSMLPAFVNSESLNSVKSVRDSRDSRLDETSFSTQLDVDAVDSFMGQVGSFYAPSVSHTGGVAGPRLVEVSEATCQSSELELDIWNDALERVVIEFV